MKFYQRKLYALLQAPELRNWNDDVTSQLACLRENTSLKELQNWWRQVGKQAQDISSSSDHLNLEPIENEENLDTVTACHPISGQKQRVKALQVGNQPDMDWIKGRKDAKEVFWWFWRFYPELLANKQHDALLFPAHTVLPDCSLHSHQSAVSALTGAMFSEKWEGREPQTPYLLVFTFSPVQEFIKSSRKFLDFWAGSYLLHYLSTKLCWHIANELGPDAVIIPSLWSQEIIDALLIQKYPDFAPYFNLLQEGKNPVNRFKEKTSTSLSTAGFPNAITVLVPGKDAAQQWGKCLAAQLTQEWVQIGEKVRKHIRHKVTHFLRKQTPEELELILKEVFPEFQRDSSKLELYRKELEDLGDEKKHGCWEWKNLWEVQLNYTWEPYWTAIPLGNPEPKARLTIQKNNGTFDKTWLNTQTEIAQPFVDLPDKFENEFYTHLNVGTWWGSIQQRLRLCLNDVKYTRNWQIATAPGERSTISGQFSAVHPRFNYTTKNISQDKIIDFREGAGVPIGSMRLFWYVMSKAYPGLFNGSEKLNALELTKRMAWIYGGVAEALGIPVKKIVEKAESQKRGEEKVLQILYEQLQRFPNLSSIASARFVHDDKNNNITQKYWEKLEAAINEQLPEHLRLFEFLTRFRPSQVPKTDALINPHNRRGRNYNGVMFSSKWLIDDMGLQREKANILRNLVYQAHKDTGFGDSSPADWWVILLADGDEMGEYVSGKKLDEYQFYVEAEEHKKNISGLKDFLNNTHKRMGPATHVGLNRALLDFSNRLVPYLTEKRFCGRVIYSGGDDVMVVLPLEDLPEYLLSLRAAWSGGEDPKNEFENKRNGADNQTGDNTTGYWYPLEQVKELPPRPHFTMGKKATMSAGIVIAHKSVPLPTVLESLWKAEGDRAKKISDKDGLCFRVIYGGGNQLEALMKGELLANWWDWVKEYKKYGENLAPLLYRLAEELPRRASITKDYKLFSKVAKVIMDSRDSNKKLEEFNKIENWLDEWESWVKKVITKWAEDNLENWKELSFEDWFKELQESKSKPVGIELEDLAKILRFTAFWVDKRVERQKWHNILGEATN